MYGRISIIGGVHPRSYVFFQCTDPLTEDEDFSPIQLFSSLDQCLCAIDFRSRSEAECRGQLNQEFDSSRLGFWEGHKQLSRTEADPSPQGETGFMPRERGADS